MAKLPASGAWVWVSPPLLASGPRLAANPVMFPCPTIVSPVTSSIRLKSAVRLLPEGSMSFIPPPAELPAIIEPLAVREVNALNAKPPPVAIEAIALLSKMVLWTSTASPLIKIPPPLEDWPVVRFPLIVLCVAVKSSVRIPPPRAPVPKVRFPLTVLRSSVSDPIVAIPPPLANMAEVLLLLTVLSVKTTDPKANTPPP